MVDTKLEFLNISWQAYVQVENQMEASAKEASMETTQLRATISESQAQLTSTAAQLSAAVKQIEQLTQQMEAQRAACLLHTEEIDTLKELLQEARQERSLQLQKSADKYHKLAILHDELKEELREDRAKVGLGLQELEQVQAENQRLSPALGKILVIFCWDLFS